MQPKIVVAGLLRCFREESAELPQRQLISRVLYILRPNAAPAEDEIGVTAVSFYKRDHPRSR